MKERNNIVEYKAGKNGYAYSAHDYAYSDMYITVPLATWLVSKLPFWLPANIITIISNSNVLLATVIAFNAHRISWPIWIFIPVLYFCYVIGDAADGIQARRTKTGSPLGEFTDHFLDTFTTGLLFSSLCFVYRIDKPWLVSVILTTNYIVQVSAFWERYKQGHLHFGKISSSDLLIIVPLFLMCGFIGPVKDFFTQPVGNLIPFLAQLNLSLIETVAAVASFLSLFISAATLIRAGSVSWRFVLYLVLSFILAAVATLLERESLGIIQLTISLYQINYSAALLNAITMKEKDPVPDLLLAAAMTVTLLLDIHTPVLYTIYFLYLVISVCIKAALFFHKNEKYWVWKNPELPEESEE